MASEALGMAFALVVICFSVLLVYRWGIKPDREARRLRAEEWIEQMHLRHWKKWRDKSRNL